MRVFERLLSSKTKLTSSNRKSDHRVCSCSFDCQRKQKNSYFSSKNYFIYSYTIFPFLHTNCMYQRTLKRKNFQILYIFGVQLPWLNKKKVLSYYLFFLICIFQFKISSSNGPMSSTDLLKKMCAEMCVC